MRDGQSLQSALMETMRDERSAIDQLAADGVAMACAQEKYRVALAAKTYELREADKMPVSLVNDLARGSREVAALKRESVRAETMYEATRQRIIQRRREAETIREMIAREEGRR